TGRGSRPRRSAARAWSRGHHLSTWVGAGRRGRRHHRPSAGIDVARSASSAVGPCAGRYIDAAGRRRRSSVRRDYGGADEATLLGWAKAGDERAFAALVEPHGRKVRAVCTRIAPDEQLAQDAAQDALLAAWRNIARFEGRARFSTWLCQIAHNAALAVVRGLKAEPVDDVTAQ